jgi:hypothetical protein
VEGDAKVDDEAPSGLKVSVSIRCGPQIRPLTCVLRYDADLRLDLSREEAVQYMQGIIQESLGALFPQVTCRNVLSLRP